MAAGPAGKPTGGPVGKPAGKAAAKPAGAAPQSDVVTGRPEVDLPVLESLLRELAFKYDQFFIGQERVPPDVTERKVQAIVRAYAQRPIQNAGQNFKYTTLVARYNANRGVWGRRLREREEGRGVGSALQRAGKAAQAEEQRQKAHRPTLGAGRPEEFLSAAPEHEGRRLTAFFEHYRRTREELGEPVAKLQAASFQRALADKIEKIKKEQGCEAVLVRLVTEGGKTRLVAKPFRRGGKPGEAP